LQLHVMVVLMQEYELLKSHPHAQLKLGLLH
jgi:hypothetical protein